MSGMSGPVSVTRGLGCMDDLNGYVLLAGVVLIFSVLAYAGYTDLLTRVRRKKGSRRNAKIRPSRLGR